LNELPPNDEGFWLEWITSKWRRWWWNWREMRHTNIKCWMSCHLSYFLSSFSSSSFPYVLGILPFFFRCFTRNNKDQQIKNKIIQICF
jgi:hypothetical protein